MTTTLELPTPSRLNLGPDDVDHVFCEICPGDMAICGYRVDEDDWDWYYGDDGPTCPLCTELEDQPCPRCGEL